MLCSALRSALSSVLLHALARSTLHVLDVEGEGASDLPQLCRLSNMIELARHDRDAHLTSMDYDRINAAMRCERAMFLRDESWDGGLGHSTSTHETVTAVTVHCRGCQNRVCNTWILYGDHNLEFHTKITKGTKKLEKSPPSEND